VRLGAAHDQEIAVGVRAADGVDADLGIVQTPATIGAPAGDRALDGEVEAGFGIDGGARRRLRVAEQVGEGAGC
jgi:hypothetical protein